MCTHLLRTWPYIHKLHIDWMCERCAIFSSMLRRAIGNKSRSYGNDCVQHGLTVKRTITSISLHLWGGKNQRDVLSNYIVSIECRIRIIETYRLHEDVLKGYISFGNNRQCVYHRIDHTESRCIIEVNRIRNGLEAQSIRIQLQHWLELYQWILAERSNDCRTKTK